MENGGPCATRDSLIKRQKLYASKTASFQYDSQISQNFYKFKFLANVSNPKCHSKHWSPMGFRTLNCSVRNQRYTYLIYIVVRKKLANTFIHHGTMVLKGQSCLCNWGNQYIYRPPSVVKRGR